VILIEKPPSDISITVKYGINNYFVIRKHWSLHTGGLGRYEFILKFHSWYQAR